MSLFEGMLTRARRCPYGALLAGACPVPEHLGTDDVDQDNSSPRVEEVTQSPSTSSSLSLLGCSESSEFRLMSRTTHMSVERVQRRLKSLLQASRVMIAVFMKIEQR